MHVKGHRRIRRQAGDTIVEVLIAIGIVSLVLTSAYAITNKNSQTMQTVQERTQAQKLVERQIELIRAATATTMPTNGGCFMDDSGTLSSNPATDCLFDGTGQSGGANGVQYKITITESAADTYTVTASWDRLGGGTNNVTMAYYEKKS